MSRSDPACYGGLRLALTCIGVAAVLTGCGGGGDGGGGAATPTLASSFAVAKANCGTGDRAEAGLQGQIPMAERAAGFQGYNCNLTKLSSSFSRRGENVWEQFVMVRDRSGRLCGYSGPAFQEKAGTTVVDLTDPNKAVETTVLTTAATRYPGEGIRVHEGRGLLVTGYYNNPPSGVQLEEASGLDVYDVGTDCRFPQLLATTTTIKIPTANLKLDVRATTPFPNPDRLLGHEGAISPDGLTYWVGDLVHNAYHAIDLADPTNPKFLASFQFPDLGGPGQGRAHGLSVSNDGTRVYPVTLAIDRAISGGVIPQTGPWHNGWLVVDTTEIQQRRPNPQMRMIKEVVERDSSAHQMTIPVTIKGSKYVISVPEGGTGQFARSGNRAACAAGLTPFAMVQIYYMGDETNPQLINKLRMEANDPKSCSAMEPEISAINSWIYDVHMCSVDNRDNATTLACSYFQSGVRVYDIRDPMNIKEIAYFNPAQRSTSEPVGWCAALPFLDATTGTMYSRCKDSGVVALKFRQGVWPFPDSSTPRDKQL